MLGEVSEWPKEHDWKSCFRRKTERGFKSRPLREELNSDNNLEVPS